MLDLLYPLLSLPLLSLALRCWARWARREGGPAFLVLGVALASFGVDGLRVLLRKVDETPAPPGMATILIIGLGIYLFVRTWQGLGRPRKKPRSLEDLLEKAQAAPEAQTAEDGQVA